VRQHDPALKAVVEHLSRGEVGVAVQHLDQQGRVHQIADRDARLIAVAQAYARATSPRRREDACGTCRSRYVSPQHFANVARSVSQGCCGGATDHR
jgi:hypothetical protein